MSRSRSLRSRPGCGAVATTPRSKGRRSSTRTTPRGSRLLPHSFGEPDSRVENTVREIDEQVDEHDDDGDEEHAALNDGIVARLDRVHEPGADPGEGEDGLGEHRPR